MKNYMICAFADEASDKLDEQITALTDNKLSGIELRNADGKSVVDLNVDEAKEIKRKLDANGLKVWSLGSPIGKVNIKDDFTAHMEQFKHLLQLSEIMDADCIRLFSFFINKDENPDSYKNEVLDRLSQFLKAAESYKAILCHENEKDIYGDTIDRCVTIHKALPELKAVFDPANFIQCGQDTAKAYDALGRYVHYLHIKDALKDGTVVAAGRGEGHIPYILSKYTGNVITIEPHLFEFIGLNALEQGDGHLNIQGLYKDARSAFDDAVAQFRKLI